MHQGHLLVVVVDQVQVHRERGVPVFPLGCDNVRAARRSVEAIDVNTVRHQLDVGLNPIAESRAPRVRCNGDQQPHVFRHGRRRRSKVVIEARARADARDYADMALTAHLDAAPKLWCIQRDLRYEGIEVLAVFATEKAASAALPRFEHMDDIAIAQGPFFPA